MAGCAASSRYRQAGRDDPVAIRKLLDGLRDPEQRAELQRRLERLEYARARQAGTAYAWRMFINQFPDSPLALDARRELENLEFARAESVGDEQAWKAFLKSWPSGYRVADARARLAELECRRLLATSDIEQLAHQSRRRLPCRQQLLQRLAQLRFRHASKSNSLLELHNFVLASGSGTIVQRARRLLATRQVPALCRAAEFAQARALLRLHGLSGGELSRSVAEAEAAWRLTSLNREQLLECEKAGRCPRGWFRRHRRWLAPLAAATARLREAVAEPPGDERELPDDARRRWLLADRLAEQASLRAADVLLELFEDDYLEVRRRAWLGLRRLVGVLGPARALAWLAAKQKRLRNLAVTGRLLLRRVLLHELGGDAAQALHLLQQLFQQEGTADPLALALGVELAERLGQYRQAAILARDFSERAEEFFEQRSRFLSPEQLEQKGNAGRSLRQLYGLSRLWRQVLAFFTGREGDDFRVELGDWLKRSRTGAKRLAGWLERMRQRWQARHPGWRSSDSPGTRPPEPVQQLRDLLQVAWLPRAWSQPTLDWVQCAHPSPRLRQLARLAAGQAGLLERSGLLLPLWSLVPPLRYPSSGEPAEAPGGGEP